MKDFLIISLLQLNTFTNWISLMVKKGNILPHNAGQFRYFCGCILLIRRRMLRA